MTRTKLSFVLEQAILQAIKTPPQPIVNKELKNLDLSEVTENSPVIQPVDFFAYHDSIQFMYDMFAALQGQVLELEAEDILDQFKLDACGNAIYAFEQTDNVKQEEDSDIFIASHHRLLAVKKIEEGKFKEQVGRLVGMNNLNKSLDTFLKGKHGVLLQPYELTSVVEKRLLGGVTAQWAYDNNPLHPCFTHVLTPAPVMGYAVEGDLKRIIGYVVHAKMLYNLLSSADIINNNVIEGETFRLKDHMALQFDTQTALRLLSYRYCIDVDDESIESIADFDKKLEKFSKGTCCIELPDL